MKVDMSEVHSALNKINRQTKSISAQLNIAQTDAQAIASSGAMVGLTKLKISTEIENYKVPLIAQYCDINDQISNSFKKAIKSFEGTVREHNPAAVIHTETLDNLKPKVKQAKSKIKELNSEINSQYSSVSDIIGLPKLNVGRIEEKLTSADKVLTNTENWLENFNSKNFFDSIKDLISKQNSALNQITKALSSGYANPKAWKTIQRIGFLQGVLKNSDNYRKMALKNYPALKMVSKKLSKDELNYMALKISTAENIGKDIQTQHGTNYSLLKEIFSLQKNFNLLDDKLFKYRGQKGEKMQAAFRVAWKDVLSHKHIFNIVKGAESKVQLLKEKTWVNYIRLAKDSKIGKLGIGAIKHTFGTIKFLSDPFGEAATHINKGLKNGVHSIQDFLLKPDISKWSNRLDEATMKAYMSGHKFKGNVLEYYGSKLVKSGNFVAKNAKKLGNVAGRISPWLTAGTIGIDGTAAYFNHHDKKTYHNVGHSVVHAGVDYVKSMGPADGAATFAMYGSTFGGAGTAAGAVIGFSVGAFNKYGGKYTKKFYDFVETGADKVVDTAGSIWKNMTKNFKVS